MSPDKIFKGVLEDSEIGSALMTSLGRTYNLTLSIRANLASGKRIFLTNNAATPAHLPAATIITSFPKGKFDHTNPSEGLFMEFAINDSSTLVFFNNAVVTVNDLILAAANRAIHGSNDLRFCDSSSVIQV